MAGGLVLLVSAVPPGWDPKIEVADVETGLMWPLGEGRAFWSPTGKRIVVDRRRPGPSGLFIVNPDGSASTKVESLEHLGFYGWSPKGRQFLVSNGHRIQLVPDDGRGRRHTSRSGKRPSGPRRADGSPTPSSSACHAGKC